jgi:hypothetical protein
MNDRIKLFLKFSFLFIGLFAVVDVIIINFGFRESIYGSTFFQNNNIWVISIAIVFFSLITAFSGRMLAKKKTRNVLSWSLICFFTNIWGLILLLLLPAYEEKITGDTKGHKGT